MLRDYVPKSDVFIKPERACSPMAIGDDGSVYASWKKPENRKMRKSQKLQFLTTLLDSMMASIYEYAGKMQEKHQIELEQVREHVSEENSRLQKKLEKLRQSVSDASAGPPAPSHLTSIEHEWDNLEKTKQTFKEQLAKFCQDRDQLEKDIVEFRTCKEAQDRATKMTMDDFKTKQA